MKTFLIWLKHSSAMAVATLVVAGCNVGPRYNRPTVSTPPAFRGADDASVVSAAQNSVADQQWSEGFREPELQSLTHSARQQFRYPHRRSSRTRTTGASSDHALAGVSANHGRRHGCRRDAALQPWGKHRQSSGVWQL